MKKKPKAWSIPFIGNTISMIKDPLGFMIKMYKKHGSVYKIKTVREEITVIAGHEANQFLNRYAKDYLLSEKIWKDFLMETGVERALISLDGPEHFNIRRILMRGYSAAMLMGKERSTLKIEKEVLDQACNEEEQTVVLFFKDLIVYVLGHVVTDVSPDKNLSRQIQLYLQT